MIEHSMRYTRNMHFQTTRAYMLSRSRSKYPCDMNARTKNGGSVLPELTSPLMSGLTEKRQVLLCHQEAHSSCSHSAGI